MSEKKHIAIVYPAGKLKISDSDKQQRINEFVNLGFDVTDLSSDLVSLDGHTSAPVMERATLLSFALTSRKFSIVLCGRGGVGTTELVPFLENLLPPVLPEKTFVGFSDNSFLGVYLALRFPNLNYIHGQMAFSHNLFSDSAELIQSPHCHSRESGNPGEYQRLPRLIPAFAGRGMTERRAFFELLNGDSKSYLFEAKGNKKNKDIVGKCVPLNLSLAESLSSIHHIQLPQDNILFLEECNEYLYRIVRKIDGLINSQMLQHTKAVVLGDFTDCLDANEKPLNRDLLIRIFEQKLGIPVYDLPIFGHGEARFPLLMNSKVAITHKKDQCQIEITNQKEKVSTIATSFSPTLFCKIKKGPHKDLKMHMTGIGGTGMAQVAGLLLADGYHVTGSDNPIYPPMDKVIADLGIVPDVGFLAENIEKHSPDAIVLANVVSRTSASLQKNEEFEKILSCQIPVLSFPSLLRKYFLHASRNIVVSGTHGKTTTSSLISFLLTEAGLNPSFLIGGSPANFKAGFALRSKHLFVLEGDEYDCALFDKGPKFLHYEPHICFINNIEFDHADIYPNVDAIENEFLRLAQLCRDRNGIVVANFDDPRVLNVAKKSGAKTIGFSARLKEKFHTECWVLKEFKTTSSGILVTALTPQGYEFKFQTAVFGAHNALNCLGAFATLHANHLLDENDSLSFLEQTIAAISQFRGVKRRFELLQEKNGVSVFDDFAHHPTAIATTLSAFRDYMISSHRTGRLVVCFDPRNATMRRSVLQAELAQSFAHADVIFLGKVPQDLRMEKSQQLDGPAVALACGPNARYFNDNEELLKTLQHEIVSGDTVVFMSSGSFDGISHKFAESL